MFWLGFFGSYWPSLIVISIWVAMFKRRQQAFSYTILICAQIFIGQFFKLVTHEGRPFQDSSTKVIDLVKDLGSPSDTALNTMSLGLTLVLERIQWHKEIANQGHNSV